ncbi:MAG: rhodanese-related sulfurtransferase [Candidatus Dependentiae bacterium]
MYKILLFYKYIDLDKPHYFADWQRELCTRLNLKGRIILAEEGINGTVGGHPEQIEEYKRIMLAHELFCDVDFKEAMSQGDPFPRLRIVVKNEIVHLGLDPKVITAANAGKYLTPEEAHALVDQKPEDLIIIDCRNKAETDVGTFVGSIRPNTNYFREFPEYVDNNLDLLKDKQVLMYCTGGVRCERASAYIKSKNIAKEVYHIKGGIDRYVEKFPDGHFRGKNYVFDGRITVRVNNDILGSCYLCNKPYDEYENCMNASCNKHFIACPDCVKQYESTCSTTCKELVFQKKVPIRPVRMKTEHIPLKELKNDHN